MEDPSQRSARSTWKSKWYAFIGVAIFILDTLGQATMLADAVHTIFSVTELKTVVPIPAKVFGAENSPTLELRNVSI
jgi:hypothetical protein